MIDAQEGGLMWLDLFVCHCAGLWGNSGGWWFGNVLD